MTKIETGDLVTVLDVRRSEHRRRALTGPIAGHYFEVIWVCREDEWEAAMREGREAEGMPWPVEDVRKATT